MTHGEHSDPVDPEGRFEKLIRHSSDIVFLVDAEGVHQYVSPAVEEVLGFEPEELVGRDGFELVHEEDRPEAQAEFARTVEDPDYEATVQFRSEAADGDWRWLEVRGRNLLDDPDVEGFVVYARDVTERKSYEAELAVQERRFHQITQHLPDTAIWMTDTDFSDVQYVSPGYEDIWGQPPKELYENPERFLTAVHPDDQARVLDGMAGLLDETATGSAPEETRIEYRVVQPDGAQRWVRSQTVPILDADGEVSAWVGITTDVTEEKERERRLDGYRVLAEAVPDGVFMVDEHGTIRFVNETWASMLDRPVEAVEGAAFDDLVDAGIVDESVVERYSDLLRELLSEETDRDRGTLTIEATPPGESTVHEYHAHVGVLPYDEAFRGCAIVVRDVTALLDGA